MKRDLLSFVALAAGSTLILGSHPALAHGMATGGALGGLTHPLLGLDHLFLLLAVGTAASVISSELLGWAMAAAVFGAAIGSAGFHATSAEVIAALAIVATAGLTVLAQRNTGTSTNLVLKQITGVVVAGGVTIHAMLHGLEAPQESTSLLWWAGDLASSVLVCGGTYLALSKLPCSAAKVSAIAILAMGGILTLGSLGWFGAIAGT